MKKQRDSYWVDFIPKSWLLLSKGYNFSLFKCDLIAGITVGVVALPLAMAFAIASGLPPESGIYTAIIGGFLLSLFGGSRLQIGGPTGAFVVIIYDIVQRHGYNGLVVITLLAGLLLLLSAFLKLGNMMKYIPYPLVTGFTTGIAVIIFSSQVKDFLGLQISELPGDFIPKWGAIFSALPSFDLTTFSVALGTLGIIICVRRFFPVIPWGISAVVVSTFVCWAFKIPVETIASRFGEMPRALPSFQMPQISLLFPHIHTFLPDALTVAFLAGIEALLSAVVADGMAGTRHKPNCELLAQGIGNITSVLFGGIPATGAIARTVTNIKSGAKTPLSGMIHALTLLVILFAFAPLVSQIPLAALSAILVMIAWNMSELHKFCHLLKAPRGDIVTLLTTFLITVFVDLTLGVGLGMIIAAIFFVKEMKEFSVVSPSSVEIETEQATYRKGAPLGIEIYEMSGPFFFAIADSLKDLLINLEYPPKVFILDLGRVPFIDATGMHALREFHYNCKRTHTLLLLSGVKKTIGSKLHKFGVEQLIGKDHFLPTLDAALSRAKEYT